MSEKIESKKEANLNPSNQSNQSNQSNPSNIVSLSADETERAAEQALRPNNIYEFVGQSKVKEQLNLLLKAAKGRNKPADHILLAGPPGLGKTTLAMIIATEMSAAIRVTSGPAITHAGDLAAILSSLSEGEVLFIDEIHRLNRNAEEMLYLAMEDFRVDVVVGKGAGATSIPLDIPHFTLVGATTRSGLLPSPLRDRFGFTAALEFYETADLENIIVRSAKLMQLNIEEKAVSEIAIRSRGTPRVANRLLRRVRDFAQVKHKENERISLDAAKAALELYEVDQLGLDRLDKAILQNLIKNFSGGPVGLSTLAMSVGEEAETIESICEPFLVRIGFLHRTPRGRVATNLAWQHLGITPPESNSYLQELEFFTKE